ncbi:ankyrin repeat, SAM and basic leucine zipper domain-containing protein 1-like [Dysidea avara]|uniref:ankyrin repeat, SAM and basic leucine zipper domain-containing protein 1-like n=1 Tax=Dysidea avara TaxID=196820 RepID=UPI003322F946
MAAGRTTRSSGRSPTEEEKKKLKTAASIGDLTTITQLYTSGVDVTGDLECGWTGLHVAARDGHCNVASALLKWGAEVDAVTTGGKYTPLHMAVGNNHTDVTVLLVDHGASVNIKDYYVINSHSSMVYYLIREVGVDPVQPEQGCQRRASELLKKEESSRPSKHARSPDLKQDFISKCLTQEASEHPTAKQLLRSPILQEVYSLMLYAAQVWRNHNNKTLESLPGSSDDTVNRHSYPFSNELGDPQKVVAESYDLKGEQLNAIRAGEVQQVDLEKYIEEHQVDILYQDIISTLDKKNMIMTLVSNQYNN